MQIKVITVSVPLLLLSSALLYLLLPPRLPFLSGSSPLFTLPLRAVQQITHRESRGQAGKSAVSSQQEQKWSKESHQNREKNKKPTSPLYSSSSPASTALSSIPIRTATIPPLLHNLYFTSPTALFPYSRVLRHTKSQMTQSSNNMSIETRFRI